MFIRFLGYFQLPIFGALDQLWKFDAKKQAIRIKLSFKNIQNQRPMELS